MKTNQVECKKCNGYGYTVGHDSPSNHNPEDGNCITCPIQVWCEDCEGTGVIVEGLENDNNASEQ